MFKGTLTSTCLIALALAVSACNKMEPEPLEQLSDRTLQVEDPAMLDAIPLEYGDLVGIVEGGNASVTLWFEKPDHTITVVGVNHARGTMVPRILVIPRR